ncbi:MAG: lipoate--protein ligase [Bacteroidales bacterium]|nr:lipoate--protein ligase [Bacteroidales bacterium]
MQYLKNPSTDAHYNMAFDEYCLQQLSSDAPLFCLWQNAPAVIVGQNQNVYTEVNLPYLRQHGIQLARRVTGGGAVYHDLQNLNFTFVSPLHDLDTDVSCLLDHIVQALQQLGVPATFSGRNDILVEEHKVGGTAKRVWHDRLMVHGTLMYDVDIPTLTEVLSTPQSKLTAKGIASVRSRVGNLRQWLPQCPNVQSFYHLLHKQLAGTDAELVLDVHQLHAINQLAVEKFATWQWNYGLSPLGTFTKQQHFACGTIEVRLCVEKGILTDIRFGGDFLGNYSPTPLIAALTGTRFEHDALLAVLRQQPVNRFFDQLTNDQFLQFILS